MRAVPASRGRRWAGGALALVGFLLSPLSWWNDLFVNVPIALGCAWVVGWVWPPAFPASFVGAYWLTNVLGLVLLQRGTQTVLGSKPELYTRKALLKDLAVAAAYTGVIVLLVRLEVLQPVQAYFGDPP